MRYDFAANACAAQWQSNVGVLPCPGADGDPNGFVLALDRAQLEDGTTAPLPTLLTFPQDSSDGYILGVYPGYDVQAGDHLQASVGCEKDATDCSVLFRVSYLDAADSPHDVWTLGEFYDGNYFNLDLDLDREAGQKVKFVLYVGGLGSATGDRALWVAPRIVHFPAEETTATSSPTATLPEPTPTPSLTPTAPATPTSTPTSAPTAAPVVGPASRRRSSRYSTRSSLSSSNCSPESNLRLPDDIPARIKKCSTRRVLHFLIFERHREGKGLHVQIPHVFGMRLDELLARIHGVAHEHIERAVGLRGIVHSHKQKRAVLGVHRRFPQLSGVHFAEALVA